MQAINRRSFISLAAMFSIFLSIKSFALELKCAVCGMPLEDHSKNHITLKGKDKATMHVCSLSCTKKAMKHDSGLNEVEVVDFNHAEKTLKGDSAFFLIKSEKIKSDLGDKVMGPYFGAFATQTEADTAQKKYGDGVVVVGIQNAIK